MRGAGRTDAGVHALAQWASFDAQTQRSHRDLQRGLNAVLPPAIRVSRLGESPQPIDALRQSRRKTYFYQLHLGPWLPPHRRHTFLHQSRPLDLAVMRQAARRLQGTHDFSAFTTEAHRQRTCVRELQRVRIMKIRDGLRMFFTAPGFLYNMVRSLSAALIAVGEGRWSLEQLEQVLASCDRGQGPATAPPHALWLMRVDWGPEVVALLSDPQQNKWLNSRLIKEYDERGKP